MSKLTTTLTHTQMELPYGSSVMVRNEEGNFVSGYYRGSSDDGDVVHVESVDIVGGTETLIQMHIPPSLVYHFRRGYLHPVLKQETVRPTAPRVPATIDYVQRKRRENHRLLLDFLELSSRPLSSAKLLALDDLRVSTLHVANTMKTWVDAGGSPSNVYVPNPDESVCRAVRLAGGHAATVSLIDFVEDPGLPTFDVLYLDFCGTFKTCADAMEKIFSHHKRLLEDEAILHLTTCRRETGSASLVETTVFPTLQAWADKYRYGSVFLKQTWKTDKTIKSSFFLKRHLKKSRCL